MTISNEPYWDDANFTYFDEKTLRDKGFTKDSIEALHQQGFPSWVAPHINIDTDYYELDDGEFFKIGEDADDQSIYIDLKTMFVLLGSDRVFINSSPSLFRHSLKLYAEMIEKAILINGASFVNNDMPSELIEEFKNKLQMIDRQAAEATSFWIKQLMIKDSLKNKTLLQAASQGNEEEVKRLIQSGVDIDVQDQDGDTPLLIALNEGHFNVAKKKGGCRSGCER